jgi:hypothetical protein
LVSAAIIGLYAASGTGRVDRMLACCMDGLASRIGRGDAFELVFERAAAVISSAYCTVLARAVRQERGHELLGEPALVVVRGPAPVAHEREVGAFAGEGPDAVGGRLFGQV